MEWHGIRLVFLVEINLYVDDMQTHNNVSKYSLHVFESEQSKPEELG